MQSASHSELELPSEHGFWVMLSVVLIAGVGRAEELPLAAGVAIVLGIATVLLGGTIHSAVRKTPWAQVASSAMLGALALPVEGIGRVAVPLAVHDSMAWMSVFAAFSLSVRAIFARARKGGSGASVTALALMLPLSTGLALHQTVPHRNTGVAALGFGGCVLFAIWRPRPRQLKQSGIIMTLLLVIALALALAFPAL